MIFFQKYLNVTFPSQMGTDMIIFKLIITSLKYNATRFHLIRLPLQIDFNFPGELIME